MLIPSTHGERHMSTSAKQRRINVLFPQELLESLEEFVPLRERNHFIVAATEKALHQARLERVLRDLREEPAWQAEDHPDLRTPEEVDRYVRTLRETWMPRSGGEAEGDVE